VISLEPAAQPFALLEKRAASDSRWLTYKLAAGSEEKTIELNVSRLSELNSVRNINSAGQEFFGETADIVQVEQARMIRLDDLLADKLNALGIHNCILKLDTQGLDLEAADGAEGLMERVVAVQTEIAFCPLYDDSPTYHESLDYFFSRDFQLLTLSPISIDYKKPAAIEFDCLLVKQRS
jgi:FkbM family methyltransferase